MKNFRIIALLILTLLAPMLLFSCQSQLTKTISRDFYGKSFKGYSKENFKHLNGGKVIVAKDETLYSIAKKYQIQLKDLAKANNIVEPYFIRVGDIIIIPALDYYIVGEGDTAYSIAKNYGINIEQLVNFNDLQDATSIKVGQKLRLNKLSTKPVDVVKKQVEIALNTEKKATEKPMAIVKNNIKIEARNNANNSKKEIAAALIKNKSLTVATAKKIDQKPAILETENTSEEKLPPQSEKKSESSREERNTKGKKNNFSWPISNPKIISEFGPKSGGLYNDGVNIAAKEGDSVKVAESGTVAYIGNELRGYGNLIIVKHSGGWITAYAHLSKSLVTMNEKVRKSQIIAKVGSTGNVNKSQLYFGLRKGKEAVNPKNYLK